MNLRWISAIGIMILLGFPVGILAQIEEVESSELFLEEYSDAFQEKFFEALKEKGIENTDRAINLLLECKQMEPGYVVLDHELASAYLMTGDLNNALEYSLNAVNAEPANYWFANTLVRILIRRNMQLDQVASDISLDNADLARNLSQSLFKNKKYDEALKWVNLLNPSGQNQYLKTQIEDSIAKQIEERELATKQDDETEEKDDPVSDYIAELKKGITQVAVAKVLDLSIEASEAYPSQPYFYYAHGWALHQQGDHKRALRSLETGLDYLIDDQELEYSFYRIMASSHKALGNTSKANMYLSKIKTGS